MKRIVIFVEGEGEAQAAPTLVSKLLNERQAWDIVFLDDHTYRVGAVTKLVKNDFDQWSRKLRAALLRKDVGGILLLLDGDIKMVDHQPFCAAKTAQQLAEKAIEIGAGANFSVAVVFAMREFESWIIAGIQSLAGKAFPDGRPGVAADTVPPDGDLETIRRDAKGWIGSKIPGGYKPTRDQAALTQMLDHQLVHDRPMRSFQRLNDAVRELVDAIRNDRHVSTPRTKVK